MLAHLDQRALAIVEECLDLEGEARARRVAEACAGSPELRAKVERMLAMDQTRFKLLPTEALTTPEAPADPVPERIGRFRVTGVIGSGGMGTIVAAERDDGVYRQQVAIKLIRAGLKGAQAQARFALERRILARLSHPGIARILDGGEADGRPYLVMEYVEGQPITVELEARRAGLNESLDRFEAICEAVSHAHRNLVVHADIKPSNVIAAADGAIKLLDFGIARLTAELDEDEIEGPYPLTKGYAAPERLSGQPPTVASDVFGLGALLHEMLTGSRPDPDGRPMSAVAAERGFRIPHRLLRGDLDAIAAKALAPDPAERYPDVAALIADLRRYRSCSPVLARRGGRRYRAVRFIARHRRGVALTMLTMIGLLAATTISAAMYFRAERAHGEAERRFQEVRGLARFMLFDLYDELRNAPGTVRARLAIAETGGHYLDRLRQVPDAPADLRLDSAIGYRRLATVQGMSGTASLGRRSEASRSFDAAEQLLRSVLSEQPRNPAALEEMGWVQLNRATVSADSEIPDQIRAAQRFFNAALAIEPDRPGARLGKLSAERFQAFQLIYSLDRPAEAIPILDRALRALRTTFWPRAQAAEARLLEVNILNRLGDATWYAGDIPGSLPFYKQADAIVSRQLAARETAAWLDRKGETMHNISSVLGETGRRGEALAVARVGINALRRLLEFGPDATATERLLILYIEEAKLLSGLGRHAEAAAASSEWSRLHERRLKAAPDDVQDMLNYAGSLPIHADLLARAGDHDAACRAARRATELWSMLRPRGAVGDFAEKREVPAAEAGARHHCAGRQEASGR
ncbi:MAG TPA: protein kinase [Allosphingosinicella sp.]|nr:protein kinase [Allosphingosinicella sp.]